MHLADCSLALVSVGLVPLSPCSYQLLPGYVVYHLGSRISGGRAIKDGLACSTGLVAVFSTLGLATYSFGSALLQSLPFTNLVAAAARGLLGVSMLLGVQHSKYPHQHSCLQEVRIARLLSLRSDVRSRVYGLLRSDIHLDNALSSNRRGFL
ncbi:MAG: hypothetical protein QXO25_04690 [Candidatus Bathyarchaeia archaeon]